MDPDYHAVKYEVVSTVDSGQFVHAIENCKGKIVDNEFDGERACSSCGAVLSGVHQIIDLSPDVHKGSFGSEALPNSLGSKDANGKSPKALFSRLTDAQRKVNWGFQKPASYVKGMPLVEQVGYKLALTEQIIADARKKFEVVVNKKLSAHRTIKVMAAASLFIAARENSVSRSLKEVCAVADVNKKELSHAVRILNKALGYKKVRLVDPIKVISKIADNCELGEQKKREAFILAKKYRDTGAPVGNPNTFSATILRIVLRDSNENLKGYKLAEISKVSLVTMRYREKRILKAIGA